MADTEDRLASIERRLDRLEQGVGTPAAPQPDEAGGPKAVPSLLFWIGLVVLGVCIWILSNRLASAQ